MTDNLDDFLNEATPETEAPEAEVTETPAEAEPEKAERPRGPDGKFIPKGEIEAAPPAAEETQGVPVKALQEERRKRQELEQEREALRQQLAALQQPQQPPPSLWEDEQGWQQHFGGQVVSEAVQAATLNARLDMSEMMVRQSHEDFEDKKAQFLEMMRDTPGLQQKAISDPHPWNFAYNYVTNHQRMQELSATNVTELEAKLREKIKAELAEQQPAPTPEIPGTLADAQSSRGSSASAAATPPTFDQILGRK